MGFFMETNFFYCRKKAFVMCAIVLLCLVGLMGRLVYLMIFQGEKYSKKASDLQYRERQLRGPRGRILDRNGLPLADNQTVCTVSVIHNQIEDSQRVAKLLARELDIDEDKILKKINKVTSIELIKSNVPIETGDRIRKENLKGIKVDVDYSRYYPFGERSESVV